MDQGDRDVLTTSTDNNSSTNTSVGPRISRSCPRCRNHGLKVAQKGHTKECKYRYCNCERCQVYPGRRSGMMARQTTFKKVLDQDEESSPLIVDEESPAPDLQSSKSQGASYVCNSSTSNNQRVNSHGNNGTDSIASSNATSTSSASSNATSTSSVSSNATSTKSTKSRIAPKCTRCRNHRQVELWKGHKRYCKYRYCKCELCLRTLDRQKEMARQIALKRALQQDELRMKSCKEELPGTPTALPDGGECGVPPVPQPVRSLEGSYDSSSGNSPVSNHGSNGVLGGIGSVVSIPTSRKLPPVHVHADSTIHLPQAQHGDNVEILLERSTKLLQLFQYPWQMVPLMYVIVKDARANLEEAVRRILEANNDIRNLSFWNTWMIQNANMFCCPGYTATAGIMPTSVPTYEGQVPYIGVPPPPSAEHLRPLLHHLNAHIPATDSPPEHPAT